MVSDFFDSPHKRPHERPPMKAMFMWNARLLFCISHYCSSWQNNWSNAEVSNLERYLGSGVCNNSSNHLQKALHAFRVCFLGASCLGWPVSGHQFGAAVLLLRKKQKQSEKSLLSHHKPSYLKKKSRSLLHGTFRTVLKVKCLSSLLSTVSPDASEVS